MKTKMKVSVWDTYVKRDDSNVMHFDILVPNAITDKIIIFNFGNEYLKSKFIYNTALTTEECRLCHMEHASEDVEAAILEKGYCIIEMENCD